jgi:acyl carrier protein
VDEKILSILKDIQPAYEFGEGVDFTKEGYLDSFDIITLIGELEETFSVTVSALETVPENFRSVESIRKLVERSRKKGWALF